MVSSSASNIFGRKVEDLIEALINGKLNKNDFFALLPEIDCPNLVLQLDVWLAKQYEFEFGKHIDDYDLQYFVAKYSSLRTAQFQVYFIDKRLSSV